MGRTNFITRWHIGIDPGADGGMVVLNGKGEVIHFAKIDGEVSNIVAFFDYVCVHLSHPDILVCTFEEYKGDQAANAARHSGMYVGIVMTLCLIHGIQFNRVSPQTWKSHFDLIVKQVKGAPKLSDTERYKMAKGRSLEKFQELFPGVNLIYPRCKNIHEGVAEAFLIAEYGRQTF